MRCFVLGEIYLWFVKHFKNQYARSNEGLREGRRPGAGGIHWAVFGGALGRVCHVNTRDRYEKWVRASIAGGQNHQQQGSRQEFGKGSMQSSGVSSCTHHREPSAKQPLRQALQPPSLGWVLCTRCSPMSLMVCH